MKQQYDVNSFEFEMLRYNIEAVEEWKKWCSKIPALHFKKEWDVCIIPPFAGAMIRFTVKYKEKHCSIYLDCYSRLGCVDEPYWEVYDSDSHDCTRFLLEKHEDMMKFVEECLEG